jgi:hypothetical protein
MEIGKSTVEVKAGKILSKVDKTGNVWQELVSLLMQQAYWTTLTK